MSVTIPVTSLRKNLDQWDLNGSTWMQSNGLGAFFALKAGPTTGFTLLHNASTLSALATDQYPKFHYSVDGAAKQWLQLTSSGSDLIASGLSNGTHTLEMWLDAFTLIKSDTNPIDLWSTPQVPQITGIQVDNGAAEISWPSTLNRTMLLCGDSTQSGWFGLGSGTNSIAQNDAEFLLPGIGSDLSCDYCVLAFASQGYVTVGAYGVPAFTTSYQFYSSGRARLVGGLYRTQYDYLVIQHGRNDVSLTATNVENAIIAQRAAAGAQTRILVYVPYSGTNRAVITAGVAQYKANHPTDLRVYFRDLGSSAETGLAGSPSAQSFDGIHPKTTRCPALADLTQSVVGLLAGEPDLSAIRARGYRVVER